MKPYEVMILIHPDQSDQVPEMLERLSSTLSEHGAKMARVENSGRRKLAYPIDKHFKAHYAVLNFEGETDVLEQLKKAFQYNDAVLRHLIITTPKVMTEKTALRLEDEADKKVEVTEGEEVLNYKNVHFLKKFVLETGRIVPSRVSGFSTKDQRKLSHAIKLARQVALIPYCDRHFK